MNLELEYYAPTDERELNPCRPGGRRLYFKGSKSSASSSTASTAIDKRAVADNQSLVNSLDHSNVTSGAPILNLTTSGGKNTTANTSITMVDSTSIKAGLDLGLKALQSNFDITKSSNENSQKTFAEALGFAGDTLGEVRDFAGDVLSSALGFVQTSNAASTASQTDAVTKAMAAFDKASASADGNQALVKTGLIVVGVVGAAMLLKR